MAAPKGNNNFAKNRPWAEAINRALIRRAEGKANALDLIANQLVNMALNGDKWAMEEIGNRQDGKSPQGINLEGQLDTTVTVEIVRYGSDK